MKAIVCSPDIDIDFFNIVALALQRNIVVLLLFILCLDYVLRTSIDLIQKDGLTLKMAKRRCFCRNYDKGRLCR